MSKYYVGGYRREDPQDKHWKHDRVRARLQLRAPSSLDLGEVDLRPYSVARHDQGALGSCVGNATVKALEIKRALKHGTEKHVDLSRLAVYYLARGLMYPPETGMDAGTYISHAFDAIRRFGVCEEKQWPYDSKRVLDAPSWMAMRRAYVNKIDSFYRIVSHGPQRVEDVLLHLHAGNPVVFGTSVTPSFYDTAADDVVGAVNGVVEGGHAMCVVGYLPNYKGGVFVIENSWGDDFADGGFFYASPEYIGDPWAFDWWACAGGWEDWL